MWCDLDSWCSSTWGRLRKLNPHTTLCSAGEAAGLWTIHGDARGAEWDEGAERARDPESKGALEAGHSCSAGGAKVGQQPGPLRVCCWYQTGVEIVCKVTLMQRTSHCLYYLLRGRYLFIFSFFLFVLFCRCVCAVVTESKRDTEKQRGWLLDLYSSGCVGTMIVP